MSHHNYKLKYTNDDVMVQKHSLSTEHYLSLQLVHQTTRKMINLFLIIKQQG